MSDRVELLLEKILAEKVSQTNLLRQINRNQLALIESLADEQDAETEQPLRTLSGKPIGGR